MQIAFKMSKDYNRDFKHLLLPGREGDFSKQRVEKYFGR